jgi:hypothetical protein
MLASKRLDDRDIRMSLQRGESGELWGATDNCFADNRLPANIELRRQP